jgi:cobalt/nickel transport protein
MMKARSWYIIGFSVVILICVSAFIVAPGGEFGGSDDQGADQIQEIDPTYTPWFESLWEPPAETASLLFAVQAAIGAAIIGYFIGNEHGKRVGMKNTTALDAAQKKAVNQKAIEQKMQR